MTHGLLWKRSLFYYLRVITPSSLLLAKVGILEGFTVHVVCSPDSSSNRETIPSWRQRINTSWTLMSMVEFWSTTGEQYLYWNGQVLFVQVNMEKCISILILFFIHSLPYPSDGLFLCTVDAFKWTSSHFCAADILWYDLESIDREPKWARERRKAASFFQSWHYYVSSR